MKIELPNIYTHTHILNAYIIRNNNYTYILYVYKCYIDTRSTQRRAASAFYTVFVQRLRYAYNSHELLRQTSTTVH